ncbi:MAG TPA: alpha/beta hydrolase [Saprospiraceae bacterium]|nr:alpha/beta hydrolase [Saprospiraceae bacterium]
MIIDKVTTHDDLSLYVYKEIVKEPVATVIMIHGFAEYARRYDEFVFYLNLAGLEVVRFDLRGHGKSEGERAYVHTFNHYISDLDLVIKKYTNPGVPLILMGQSMGGLIATKYLLDQGEGFIGGLVLLSPLLYVDPEQYSPLLIRMSGFLGKYLPRLKTIKVKAEYLSRTPGIMEAYINDGLIYTKGIKSRLGHECLRAMLYVKERLSELTLPVLIMHGTGDNISDWRGSQDFYDQISSEDKKFIKLEGFYHELLREPEHEEVFAHVRDWLTEEARLLSAPTLKDLAQ